jgi:ribosomal protein S6
MDAEQNESLKVYELGFHFLPTIAEDDVAVQFSHLKSFIEKRGGEFISEDFPKLRDLAYEISKTVKSQKKRYTKAYFGWVKFTLEADKVEEVEKELKAFDPMLRYLLIKTVAENTLSSVGKEEKRDKDQATDGVAGEVLAEGAEAHVEKTTEEVVQ